MLRKLGMLFLGMVCMHMSAQNFKQIIKGCVIDADSHENLTGVNIYIIGTNPPQGTITDLNGNYTIDSIPIGRYSIQYSFMGYEPVILKEISIGSAKALELNVKMRESFKQIDEVVVKPHFRKDKPLNEMATLSARTFSIEEASRYAGGWNDPSRLAGSFAGVTMAEGVNDNAIVIRGNAPKGILWYLEGVEIPSPNHLNGVNNGGGIETVFSVNMLSNSDFFTAAFPAEYGNAVSGVFDMKFRNGNSNHFETSFQVGSQGIDISAEGPFNKNHKTSFLFNYRYSTMGLAKYIIGDGFGLPAYEDISYKIHLPTNNYGNFSIWGIGGLSEVSFEPDIADANSWTNTFDSNKYKTGSTIAATGLSHHIHIGKSSYLTTSLAFTYDQFAMKSDQMQSDGSLFPLANHHENNNRWILKSTLNSKLSKRLSNKSGLSFTSHYFDLDIDGNENPGVDENLISIVNQRGSTEYARAFSQFKWRVSPTIDMNAGINISYFNMNMEWVTEPRTGITWRFVPKQSLSFAFGWHSRLEPIRFYEATDNNGQQLNADLKISKARHYVLSYDYLIDDNIKLKIEPYYQKLYDIPVIAGSSESLINYTWDMYFEDPLINTGSGTNKGIDITLERYMKDGFYYMFTGSIFDSKYKGGDGIERNTSFNRSFVFNLMGGKEWIMKINNVFGINGKIAYMGGNRFTPPNQELSRINKMVVLDESKAFEWQEKNKLFVDLAFSYRLNKRNKVHIFSLQGKNILLQEEMFGWAYDFNKEKVVSYGTTMVYPYFTYRLEF